jgi:hypothetical protein
LNKDKERKKKKSPFYVWPFLLGLLLCKANLPSSFGNDKGARGYDPLSGCIHTPQGKACPPKEAILAFGKLTKPRVLL